MAGQDMPDFHSADPFASGQRSSNVIHIRIQQRSGKKTLTTVQV
jgi:translation initiation factor 1 (eIF-1/SUI1)